MILEYLAFKARLQLPDSLRERIFEAAREDDRGALVREQYVILTGGPADDLDDERMTSPQSADSDATYVYGTRSVAVTAEGALRLASEVSLIIGAVLDVDGRKCTPVERIAIEGIFPDRSVLPPLYYVDQDFSFKSSRA